MRATRTRRPSTVRHRTFLKVRRDHLKPVVKVFGRIATGDGPGAVLHGAGGHLAVEIKHLVPLGGIPAQVCAAGSDRIGDVQGEEGLAHAGLGEGHHEALLGQPRAE